MAKVTVEQVPQATITTPKIRVEFQGKSGVQSHLSWDNIALVRALSDMFDLNSNELLSAVVITEKGITAEITRK